MTQENNHHKAFPSFATDAVHAGQHPDPHTGAVMVPISLSTTFAQKSPGIKYPGNSGEKLNSNFQEILNTPDLLILHARHLKVTYYYA